MPCANTPCCEQPIGQLHRQRAVADDDRRDRALAEAGVEAERLQARLEEARVLPQPLDELRLLSSTSSARDARGGDRRRMRGREQERPRAVIEELDERRGCRRRSRRARRSPSTACRPGCRRGRARRSDRWCRGRSRPNTPLACASSTIMMQPNSSASVAQLGQRAEVAVHAEDAVGDEQLALRRPAAPARTARAASTSLCGNTLIVARLRRQPSMMLA